MAVWRPPSLLGQVDQRVPVQEFILGRYGFNFLPAGKISARIVPFLRSRQLKVKTAKLLIQTDMKFL